MKCAIDLQRAYREYNRRYFGGRLPRRASVKWSRRKLKRHGLLGQAIYSPYLGAMIRVSWAMRKFPSLARLTLLHEMEHIDVMKNTRGGMLVEHGPVFQKGMLRLARAGALKGLW